MKKVFLLCLFILLSLGVFAQKIKSDGKPHFDKILWTLWSEKASDRDEPSGMGLLEIVKKKGNYYFSESYIMKNEINQVNVKSLKKLEIYQNIYLIDNEGNIYGYDLAKKKPVLIDKDLNIIKYYYEYHD
ncbi:hypothetical protein KST09_10140 [Fusobacterium animalis]|uniref:hypothetical protein n=1 Tax=Fusobacterium animalis TaxID=76859 RepID=UPI0030CDD2F2